MLNSMVFWSREIYCDLEPMISIVTIDKFYKSFFSLPWSYIKLQNLLIHQHLPTIAILKLINSKI